jgi:hypothetical protein
MLWDLQCRAQKHALQRGPHADITSHVSQLKYKAPRCCYACTHFLTRSYSRGGVALGQGFHDRVFMTVRLAVQL